MVEKLSGRDMIFNVAIAKRVNELIDELEEAGAFDKDEVEKLDEKVKPMEVAKKVNEVIDVAEEKEILTEDEDEETVPPPDK